MHQPLLPTPGLDDLVGLDLVAALSPERQRRFQEQLAGIPLDRPVVPSGFAPYMHLPAREPATLTRARLAKTLEALAAANNGTVLRDDVLAAGFTPAEISRHFAEAVRIAGLARMAV